MDTDTVAVGAAPSDIKQTLQDLVDTNARLTVMKKESKIVRDEFKRLSDKVQEHMQDNAVRAYSMNVGETKYAVSLINAHKFPAFKPEFIHEALDVYFATTSSPSALDATRAVFEYRKTKQEESTRIRLKAGSA